MRNDRDAIFKTMLQIFSILCLIGLVSMIFHKAYVDISVLRQAHSGADFWTALARYFFRNLAG